MKENGAPGKKHSLTNVNGNFFTCYAINFFLTNEYSFKILPYNEVIFIRGPNQEHG